MFGGFRKLIIDDRVTAFEYALLGSVIGVAIAAVVETVGSSLGIILAPLAAGF
jgi:Flp pilus assembly pilin Flp